MLFHDIISNYELRFSLLVLIKLFHVSIIVHISILQYFYRWNNSIYIKNLGNMILFSSLSHQSMYLFDMYNVPKYILTKYFSHKLFK